MRLGFAFFASAAEAGADGKFSVLGGDFDLIELARLPGRISTISLVAKIIFSSDEWGQNHELRISFTSPSSRDIMPVLEGEVDAWSPVDSLRIREYGTCVVLDLNGILFREEGMHTLHIACDGGEIGTLPLLISSAKKRRREKGARSGDET